MAGPFKAKTVNAPDADVIQHEVHTEEEERTYTVRELIQALADAEDMDSVVTVSLAALQHVPVNVTSVEYDPENQLYVLNAG